MAFERDQVWLMDAFLGETDCRDWLDKFSEFQRVHRLPEIHRPVRGRSLRYSVIHGEQVAEFFPDLESLYRGIRLIAEEKSGLKLEAMRHKKVGINVNLTPPGGEYRWHYDRNVLTAILFLNQVEGGETEIYPGYRFILKGKKHSAWQERLDRILMAAALRRCLGRRLAVAPQAGRLLLMRGNRCLHSVKAVRGSRVRVNILFSYDEIGATHPQEEGLNDYLYTVKSMETQDPNYLP